jgi:predicted Zn-dependent protease
MHLNRHRPPTLRRRALATVLAAAVALSGHTPVLAQVRLPALGDAASQDLSVSAERRIGLEIMREARRDPALLDDPVLMAYLQHLWQPLVAAARERGDIGPETAEAFAWEIFLVQDRSVNAFALPGGFVGVHLGLIALTTTRDQLASVLAHELAHVTQRHIARSVAVSQRSALVSVASVLLAILAAGRSGNADAVNATIAGGQAAAIQGQLNFSRDMEREADRIGFQLMGAAGFDLNGMGDMFQRMGEATRLSDSNAFPYLRTHPLTVERLSEARSRALLPVAGQGGEAAPPLLHALMQARARLLMDPSSTGLQRLGGESSSPELSDQVAAAYAGALSASLRGQHDRARTLLAQARTLAASAQPREPAAEQMLALTQLKLALAEGQPQAALEGLQALPTRDSPLLRRPALLLAGETAAALHRQDAAKAAAPLRDSASALQTWLADHPLDASAWQTLAAVHEALGQRARALRAAAEARAAVSDLTGAIDRLRVAQQTLRDDTPGDFIEASVLDARLRALTAERRQLALELRGRGGPGGEPPPP